MRTWPTLESTLSDILKQCNVNNDYKYRDPELTETGQQQARDLCRAFPYSKNVGLVITSPLRRSIETTLNAFTNILDTRYFDKGSGNGIVKGARLLVDPDIQERSSLPCDVGSDRPHLESLYPNLDFSCLPADWPLKEGFYSTDEQEIDIRASRFRRRLKQQIAEIDAEDRRDVIIVTHAGFMRDLLEDPGVELRRGEWKSFAIQEKEDGDLLLNPVED